MADSGPVFADLRRLVDAWEVEITTPRNAATDAYKALTDVLLDDTAVVAALLDVAEAALFVLDYEDAPPLSNLRSALVRAAVAGAEAVTRAKNRAANSHARADA